MIAFLHTSEIHIKRFSELAKKINPEIHIIHYVNTDLLTYALENNKIDTESFKVAIKNIKKAAKPYQIICICSTYGEACNNYKNVERIDAPIAEYLVKQYNTIALSYTATSTAVTSKKLLLEEAKKQNKEINIVGCNCSDAWQYFNDGSNNYELSIVKHINNLDRTVDAIFLAQTSMEGAKNYTNKELKIYSSSEFGLNKYLNKQKRINR